MRLTRMTRTFLVVGVALLVFFLLKRPAYSGGAELEPFVMDGGDLVKYVGIGIAVLLGLAGIMYVAIWWMERGNPTPQFNNYGRRIS